MFIKDMFYFHEHARKINIWASLVIISPYLGPMFSAFITITLKWQWAFAIYSIMSGLCLLALVLFGDETYYDRTIPTSEQPPRGSKLMRLVGISQWQSRKQRSTLTQALARPFLIIIRLPVFIAFISYVFSFAWVIGINTTLSIFLGSVYNFGQREIGRW
jgi:MFS family permease